MILSAKVFMGSTKDLNPRVITIRVKSADIAPIPIMKPFITEVIDLSTIIANMSLNSGSETCQ